MINMAARLCKEQFSLAAFTGCGLAVKHSKATNVPLGTTEHI